ncbi:MAG: CRISPR system precrRNA processing endoribonuclease RAMP protein Cas6 [Anaerolineales bacterium]
MDLFSLVLFLIPAGGGDPEKPLPRWWGRAAHALMLDTIRQADPNLAQQLHDSPDGPRPYTVSTLMGPKMREKLDPAQTYRLRLTALRKDLAQILGTAAQPGGALSPGKVIDLDYHPFQIANPKSNIENQKSQIKNPKSPWVGETTYQALGAPYLLASQTPERRVHMQFTSPTTFKSQGRHVPIPTPSLVFGSLLNRWNAFAPVVFPEEVKRYADECLVISRYQLESRVAEVKAGGRRMGGVGKVTYATVNYDRYWMSLIQTLARFAPYSGVGAGTTMGLGQCRIFD